MDLVSLLIAVLVLCIILWVIHAFLPFDSRIKTLVMLVVVVIVLIWLLRGSGSLAL